RVRAAAPGTNRHLAFRRRDTARVPDDPVWPETGVAVVRAAVLDGQANAEMSRCQAALVTVVFRGRTALAAACRGADAVRVVLDAAGPGRFRFELAVLGKLTDRAGLPDHDLRHGTRLRKVRDLEVVDVADVIEAVFAVS